MRLLTLSLLPLGALANVYYCQNANFGAPCNWSDTVDRCVNLGRTYAGQISALGPDPGWICTFYEDWDCPTDPRVIIAPVGDADRFKAYKYPGEGWIGHRYNDRFLSYKCVREQQQGGGGLGVPTRSVGWDGTGGNPGGAGTITVPTREVVWEG